jgi:hypothetical protein
MTDEGWDTLPPEIRTAIQRRGEEVLGLQFYGITKDAFYEFADRALLSMDLTVEVGAKQYEQAMQDKAAMGG